MNNNHPGVRSGRFSIDLRRVAARYGPAALAVALLGSPLAMAHTPVVDANLADWCLGAFSNTAPGGGRTEDSAATLTCGNCSVTTNQACEINTDCPGGETCINTTSKVETVWWDNRTDGAVNDLGTVAVTQDNSNLYFAAELWVDPDPVSLPFGQIAIDFEPGGIHKWHDPNKVLVEMGNCSVSTDRGCTEDADCHFCAIDTEPFPSARVRTCGSSTPNCSAVPGDVCDTSQTCVNLGTEVKPFVGRSSDPGAGADYLVLFDFSLWLVGAGDAVMLMQPGHLVDANYWDPVLGCPPDFSGDTTACDFPPAVNPGASGGSGGPPGSVEVAIPWSAFGCTGCPAACSCPGFGPGQDFRFTMTVARGNLTLDFTPDGAHEDTISEPTAGVTTQSSDSCPGFGIGNTACELANDSVDAFIPASVVFTHEGPAGGAINELRMTKNAAPSVTLDWGMSCSSADTDYAVYQGNIGVWNSHVPVTGLCSTGGGTAATFNYGAGSHYYLVVPIAPGSSEGSYGQSSAGVERPLSVAPCTAGQVLGICY